jgi:predicted O-methyltransferase YrrM
MMPSDTWRAVDQYLERALVPADEALEAALRDSAAANLPAINVPPAQGRFLQLLAQAIGARAILEIGTLGGYSTIWLARALAPGGRVVTIEADPTHAAVARGNITRAGLDGVVECRLGRAHDCLTEMAAEGAGPFDLIFIDADKPNYAGYFRQALDLSRVGTVIIADNVIRNGAVRDPETADPNVQGVQRLIDAMAGEARVSATALQTVCGKGYDGFAMALVTS